MKILFIGDVVGRPGRDLIRRGVPLIVDRFGIDLTIANVENAAAGAGITRDSGDALLSYGVDVMTTGNHVWDKREALAYIGAEPRLLRPLNMSAEAPGRGSFVARASNGMMVGVINAMGRVFMPPVDNPFPAVLAEVERLRQECRFVIVDVHAEASAEKVAMGCYLAGKVTAVVGTHTHVPTADARVLEGGTAYVTDVGMTGPHDSIIGVQKAAALSRFLTGLPARLEPASEGLRFQAVIITANDQSGHAEAIERLDWTLDEIISAGRDDDRDRDEE
ncbi:MAG: TIGR00282 family metallophosphoesterase [Acidobacteria bacterium]|nr:TIGR00282 family metallophosphoesterase [Acidobacteriota bacterium]